MVCLAIRIYWIIQGTCLRRNNRKPETGNRRSEIGGLRPETGDRRTEKVRNGESENGRKGEIRELAGVRKLRRIVGRKPEIGGRKPEIGERIFSNYQLTIYH